MKRSDYPADWKRLSLETRKAAGNKCELCFAPNGVYGLRGRSKLEQLPWYPDHADYSKEGFRRIKIVLTVHHIDGNRKNNSKHNRIALCQRCHLRLDREKHIRHRKARRQGFQETLEI